jgi:hypothetical protein
LLAAAVKNTAAMKHSAGDAEQLLLLMLTCPKALEAEPKCSTEQEEAMGMAGLTKAEVWRSLNHFDLATDLKATSCQVELSSLAATLHPS